MLLRGLLALGQRGDGIKSVVRGLIVAAGQLHGAGGVQAAVLKGAPRSRACRGRGVGGYKPRLSHWGNEYPEAFAVRPQKQQHRRDAHAAPPTRRAARTQARPCSAMRLACTGLHFSCPAVAF